MISASSVVDRVNLMGKHGTKPKAVALLSGGLDSTLATVVVQRLGVEVTALTFLTPFGCDAEDRSSCSHNALPAARQYGFTLKMCHLGDKFIEIVKNPLHGHGKNMNPCIDCRILMLREAKVFMEMTGADFLVTGEVVGQRPMSQMRNTLRMIEKRAGVVDLVLRPLCARHLPETRPERDGLIDRERLYGFHGRSRKAQIALAEELGVRDYPAPAGGCLLTDPIYSGKLSRFLVHHPDLKPADLRLLGVGRQFLLQDGSWIVSGRNMAENEVIHQSCGPQDLRMHVPDAGSPVTLLRYASGSLAVETAARICARFSDKKRSPSVDVAIDGRAPLTVAPASDDLLERIRLH